MEGCPSGRWCNLGKVVWGQLHRGFESPPFRHAWRFCGRSADPPLGYLRIIPAAANASRAKDAAPNQASIVPKSITMPRDTANHSAAG